MITREEFDIEWDKIDIIEGCTIGYHCNQTDKLVDKYTYQLEQHIKSLEAQLANTEQLACDKCVEKDKWKFNYFPMQCEYCSMRPRKCYFQPKDTK